MTNTKAREMLDGGYRMPAPENAPEEMYQLMLRCWQVGKLMQKTFKMAYLKFSLALHL